MKVLVTGGAGFIGSYLVDELIKEGHDVRVLDNLEDQVHHGKIPSYLNPKAEFVKGDVTNYAAFEKAIEGCEIIFHQASAVGLGQSLYKIEHFVKSNCMGTANLLDILVNKKHNVKKVLVAASMAGYGEGAYECTKHGIVRPELRTQAQIDKYGWEPICPKCQTNLDHVGITEDQAFLSPGIYALTKKIQEDMVLSIGRTYSIPSVALRYFGVYGPRQSLSNPYTGVNAIFISRIKNGNSPIVYEDGLQSRDFIYVKDIVSANLMCMKNSSANYHVFNVSSGVSTTIKECAETAINLLGSTVKPEISMKFRKGDIRHCTGNISKIQRVVGWNPEYSFEAGMKELIEWSKKEEATDKTDEANDELKQKGLL